MPRTVTDHTSPIPVVIDTSSLVAHLRQLSPYQKPLARLWRQGIIKPFATTTTLSKFHNQLKKTLPNPLSR